MDIRLISVLHSDEELRMLVLADMAFDVDHTYASDVDVPAIDRLSLWYIDHQSLLIRASVYDLQLGKSNAFLVPGGSRNTRHHHELDQLGGLRGEFRPLCLL
jgi:hypothetical protein